MKNARIIWGVWIFLLIIGELILQSFSLLLALVVSILIPIGSILLTKVGSQRLDVNVIVSEQAYEGENIEVTLDVKQNSLIPIINGMIELECHNYLTGEKSLIDVPISALPKKNIRIIIDFISNHCGAVDIKVGKVKVFDPFMLFEQVYKCGGGGDMIFFPEIFPVEIEIAYGESVNLDSNEYSMLKPGSDPSETFAIREYRGGDKIRQIHWKLSEKFDELMVREHGLPIKNTILLLFETKTTAKDCTQAAKRIDAIAGGLFSLSNELIRQSIPHSIGWFNERENNFYCEEIDSQERISEVIANLLFASPRDSDETIIEKYAANFNSNEFAHVVIFSLGENKDDGILAGHAWTTEIVCKDNQKRTIIETQKIIAEPENLRLAMANIEI